MKKKYLVHLLSSNFTSSNQAELNFFALLWLSSSHGTNTTPKVKSGLCKTTKTREWDEQFHLDWNWDGDNIMNEGNKSGNLKDDIFLHVSLHLQPDITKESMIGEAVVNLNAVPFERQTFQLKV
jgi:hypothetical protein